MALIRGRGHPYRTRVQDLEEREHAYAHGQRNPTLLRARGDVRDTVVLVHGSWGDHHNWDAVAPMLARSFRVLTYDRRGHSPGAGHVPHATQPAAYVRVVAAFIARASVPAGHPTGNREELSLPESLRPQ